MGGYKQSFLVIDTARLFKNPNLKLCKTNTKKSAEHEAVVVDIIGITYPKFSKGPGLKQIESCSGFMTEVVKNCECKNKMGMPLTDNVSYKESGYFCVCHTLV